MVVVTGNGAGIGAGIGAGTGAGTATVTGTGVTACGDFPQFFKTYTNMSTSTVAMKIAGNVI